MATKVFCDRCGKEIKHHRFSIPMGRNFSKCITIWCDGFEVETDCSFRERIHREICFKCYKDFRVFFNKPTQLREVTVETEEGINETKQD